MENVLHDCRLDAVLEMEELGVGVGELVQYAIGTLSQEDQRQLLSELQRRCGADLLENGGA